MGLQDELVAKGFISIEVELGVVVYMPKDTPIREIRELCEAFRNVGFMVAHGMEKGILKDAQPHLYYKRSTERRWENGY